MKKYKAIIGLFLLAFIIAVIVNYVRNHVEDFKIIENVSLKDFLILSVLSLLFYMSSIIEIELVARFCKIKIKIWDNINMIMVTLLGNYFFPYSGVGFRAGFLKKVYRLKYADFVSTFAATFIIKLMVYASLGAIGFALLAVNNNNVNMNHIIALFVIVLLSLIPFIPFNFKNDYKGENKLIIGFLDVYCTWSRVIKDWKLLFGLFLLTIFEFLVLSLVFMMAYRSFGINVIYMNCFLPTSFSVLSFVFKITPGSLGIYEGLIMFSSSIIGVSMLQGLLVATLIRIAGLVWILPCGLISLIFLSKKLKLSRIGTE